MIGGTETVEFSAHLDQVRVRVTDGEGRQLASILRDIPEAFDWHAELSGALVTAQDHREAKA